MHNTAFENKCVSPKSISSDVCRDDPSNKRERQDSTVTLKETLEESADNIHTNKTTRKTSYN